MIACSPIKTCVKHIIGPSRPHQKLIPQSLPYAYLSLGFAKPNYATKITTGQSLTIKNGMHLVGPHNMNMRSLIPKQRIISRKKWSLVSGSWMQGCTSAGLVIGLLVCNSRTEVEPVHAEVKENNKQSHGKQVYIDYSVIGIPGDGRCLFRAVAHGACVRSGKPAPNESLQRELADELRARVADEFVRRRKETEWFIEGDFDSYVSKIRKTHVWGGEPELLMASHVLKMPISVYMNDEDSGGLICIAEYGHEYGKENPINILYDGFGHYDALHVPNKNGSRSRL
ncbi:putative OTU domain, papain-like cysteine peptidase superfamily [Helianthus anomalus]